MASLRMLGVDLGEVRIGLAVSDATGTLCSPLETLKVSGDPSDVRRITQIAAREQAVRIVVGLPINMDGSFGVAARRARAFCGLLRKESSLPVVTFDERLTSFEAEMRLRAGGVQPSRQRHRVDAAAAALILEGYLATNQDAGRESG